MRRLWSELGFGEMFGIGLKIFVDQAQVAVVGVAGAIGIVAQGQQVGEADHRIARMLIVDRIDILAAGGADVTRAGLRVEIRAMCRGVFCCFHTPAA